MGGSDVKEEGVETEEGAGNPTGNTPVPHNTGVGVSTRRTTYVMVSDRKSWVWVFLFICICLTYSNHAYIHTGGSIN